jgi:hypothetical protein
MALSCDAGICLIELYLNIKLKKIFNRKFSSEIIDLWSSEFSVKWVKLLNWGTLNGDSSACMIPTNSVICTTVIWREQKLVLTSVDRSCSQASSSLWLKPSSRCLSGRAVGMWSLSSDLRLSPVCEAAVQLHANAATKQILSEVFFD